MSSRVNADGGAASPLLADMPLGPAFAATEVNATVWRVNSLVSDGQFQFVAYYDAVGKIVVGQRDLSKASWDLLTLPITANVRDAHNAVVIGISGDGLLHLSYDHHGGPLHYRISAKPHDIHSFGPERAMTGDLESHVTYPQFISAPDGKLYFFYRDGASGNGSLCLNRYDGNGNWKKLAHPLIDGQNQRNPYWWRPAISSTGVIHLAWCWRDSPDAKSNHDLCYTRSEDGGKTWLTSLAKPQATPITLANADVALPIATGSNLINQCSATVDPQGRPHLVQYFNDAAGIPQYFHVWFDGKTWQKNQISQRTKSFSVGGAGTLSIPISRPEIAIDKTGGVYVLTRQSDLVGGIHIYHASAPYEKWDEKDLLTEDLGDWEPSYDQTRWRDAGIMSIFVLPVHQGNHERVTSTSAQTARVVEWKLGE